MDTDTTAGWSRRGLFTAALATALLAACQSDTGDVDVRDHGAKGDGTTDDTKAFITAIAAAAQRTGRVRVPATPGGYVVGTISLPSSTTLEGVGTGAMLIRTGSGTDWIVMEKGARRVTVRNLTLSTSVAGKTRALTLSGDNTHISILECRMEGPDHLRTIGIEVSNGVSTVEVQSCSFTGFGTPVDVVGAVTGLRVADCRFGQWIQRAIRVHNPTGLAARKIQVLRNTIEPHAPGGSVRQPVQFHGGAGSFVDVSVSRNTVRGLGTDYRDPLEPGSADLISLHGCRRFEVSGNTCTDGGDIGITVSQQCEDGSVTDNVCERNDTSGICIGSGTTQYVRNIIVSGNRCVDNGQNRLGEGKMRWRTGIRVYRGTNIEVRDNELGNSGALVQHYGVTVVGGSAVEVGRNTSLGTGAAILRESVREAGVELPAGELPPERDIQGD